MGDVEIYVTKAIYFPPKQNLAKTVPMAFCEYLPSMIQI